MTLKEIIEDLSYGYLHTSNLVSIGTNKITATKLPIVISSLNQALSYVSANFNIIDKYIDVLVSPNIHTYTLIPAHAHSNKSNAIKYILDDVSDPFTGDINMIYKVTTASGVPVAIGDNTVNYYISTVNYNTFRVERLPTKTAILKIYYYAKHPEIPLTWKHEDDDITILLPDAFSKYVKLAVAGNVLANSTDERSSNLGALFTNDAKYCLKELEHRGFFGDVIPQNPSKYYRGYP